MAKAHIDLFEEADIDINIFHNDEIKYSGIQLNVHQSAPEWTAIGEDEVVALKLWFDLFRQESAMALKNTVVINEKYTPEFLKYKKSYQVNQLVIPNELSDELREFHIDDERHDRMERYLYGNIQRFFDHIAFSFDKSLRKIDVVVLDIKRKRQMASVYHGNIKTSLNVNFRCNFRLPQMVRFGQSTALGYGKIWHR